MDTAVVRIHAPTRPLTSLWRDLAARGAALIVYPLIMRWTSGETVGKRLVRLRVTRDDGNHMTLRRATLRELVLKMIIFQLAALGPGPVRAAAIIAAFIDLLWPLRDAEHRALHDFAASTHVVVTRA